jgi:aryl-alcohol dehydrogenase-like predicted oxidoreductase
VRLPTPVPILPNIPDGREGECLARERSISLLEVAIGGLAAQPRVGPVITGATTPAQIRANARAGDWQPSPDDLEFLNSQRRRGK